MLQTHPLSVLRIGPDQMYWATISGGPYACYLGCAYKVLQTVQISRECSMVLCIINPVSHPIRVWQSLNIGLLSVAIFPQCAASDVNQYSLTVQF